MQKITKTVNRKFGDKMTNKIHSCPECEKHKMAVEKLINTYFKEWVSCKNCFIHSTNGCDDTLDCLETVKKWAYESSNDSAK